MLLNLVQGIEWLSGLFVRCTIQKGKEWSANDSSPYHKPHECGFKKKKKKLRPEQNGKHFVHVIFNCKFLSFDTNFMEVCFEGSIDSKSALFHIMAWHLWGNKLYYFFIQIHDLIALSHHWISLVHGKFEWSLTRYHSVEFVESNRSSRCDHLIQLWVIGFLELVVLLMQVWRLCPVYYWVAVTSPVLGEAWYQGLIWYSLQITVQFTLKPLCTAARHIL